MKKGFTLVELIATIVILGIVMALIINSMTKYTQSLNERQRESTIKKIETAASKYAFDTNKEMVFVQELVDTGYYTINDESGEVLDPISKVRLNCNVVKMKRQGTYYVAEFLENTRFEKADGTCDTSKLSIRDNNLSVSVKVNGTAVSDYSNWLKGSNVELTVTSSVDCTNNECLWLSNSGLKEEGKKTINIKVADILKSKYTFQYSVVDGGSVVRSSKTIELKIDNEKPLLRAEDIIIEDKNKPTATKNIEIDATDGNGSGIASYAVNKTTGNTCGSYTNSKTREITSNGTYLVCVKDKVGNISSVKIDIQNIQ
jgi:prepilin-type N-terminal cleavage/methylation domain-containing protein